MKESKRTFLLLKDDPLSKKAKQILESPLKLAESLVVNFIEKKLDVLKQNLDSIKQFAAGIKAAEEKGSNYTLAKIYPYYFAFHQFVHSSFRARQGKVLEELFKVLFREHPEYGVVVLDKSHQKNELKVEEGSFPDYDLFLKVNSQFIIIIQIRSRDDTGGTTAKTSLVEGLDYLHKANINIPIYYTVFVWEGLNSSQKQTTINKFFNFLSKELINDIDINEFSQKILSDEGVLLKNSNKEIHLNLIYGKDNFISYLRKILNLDNNITTEFEKLIELVSNWDDLWVSYSIIGREYERLKEKGESFVFDLINFIKERKFEFNFNNYEEIEYIADLIASEFNKSCPKEAPFDTPRNNFLYFRDIVFLLAIYHKKKIFSIDA